jgi:hypothetical protein
VTVCLLAIHTPAIGTCSSWCDSSKGASQVAVFAESKSDVMLTKAFLDREQAEDKAARLNEINDGFWHYFVCIARFVEDRASG